MEYFDGDISMKEKFIKASTTLAAALILGFVGTFILQLIWNHFAPMFNLPILGYWETYALKIGTRMLCKGTPISTK